MKWVLVGLAVAGGLLVAAVLVLLLLGLRPGAGRIDGHVEVAAPPDAVWPWIVEGDRLTQWVSWLTEVHDLTPGRDGLGSRRRWVMVDPTMNNQRVEIVGEVTAYEPGRLSVMSLDAAGMFTGTGTYRLTDLGGGRTRVDYLSEFRMGHWAARLFEPVVTSQARRKALSDLEALRRAVEGAAAEGV